MLLYEIVDAFRASRIKYALVGGYALALHGIVRATVDVDLVLGLTLKDFRAAEEALAKLGLQSRLPIRAQDVIKMREEYITNRNLIAWSFVDYKNPARQVDILIDRDLGDLDVQSISVSGRKISVATLPCLLKMKEEAGRPQDLVDAENIRRSLHAKKS